jgi:small-conductance mechanosensitive channel
MTQKNTPSDIIPTFAEQFIITKDKLLQSLATADFYLELSLIGLSLGLGIACAHLITRLTERRMESHSGTKGLLAATIKALLKFAAPVLCIIFLTTSQGVMTIINDPSVLVITALKLSYVWLAMQIASMVIGSRIITLFIGVVVLTLTLLSLSGFLTPTTALLSEWGMDIGSIHISALTLIKGVTLLVVLFWFAGAFSRLVERSLTHVQALDISSREIVSKLVNISIYIIAFIVTLNIIGVDLTALAVVGGALGVGIGFGLQKITSNFVSGLILLFEKSVKRGDLIEIDGNRAWVKRLGIRHIRIETFDGRDIMVPNEDLITRQFTNWTHSSPKARIDIKVGVSYGADPHQVRDILLACASENPRCLDFPEPLCVMENFGADALEFLLLFWVQDIREGLAGTKSEVMIAILEALRAKDISIPYPQRDVHIISQPPAASKPE